MSSRSTDLDVGERDRGGDGMAAEGEAVGEARVPRRNGSATRSEAIIAPIGTYAEVSPFAVVMMSGT